MANCSIPNSIPANGRISTRSSRRSRKRSSKAARYEALSPTKAVGPWSSGFFNAQRSTLKAQRSIQTVESWALDVGRSAFSSIWRVKGAWWPSRSSKPSSSRKWRGRFDSYPLRLTIFDRRLPIVDCSGTGRVVFSIPNRNSKIENQVKGGDLHVP
jgi:hypothetical protein